MKPKSRGRLFTGSTDKRKDKKPGQGKRIWVTELTETNGHTFVTCLWLITIGPEKAVPPGEIKTKVAIVFTNQNRMMDPMHFWRDNEESHPHGRWEQEEGHCRG